jgi:two-component sensor histidine kinase
VITFTDITQRKAHEEHQKMLIAELDHRVKNTLAVVSALCSQSAEDAESVDDFRTSFDGRIHAMAAAHRQLSRSNWRGAELRSLIEETVAPHMSRDGSNLNIDGPKVVLTSKAALAFALVIHELSTNAAKYGPLGRQAEQEGWNEGGGHLDVTWNIISVNHTDRLRIVWKEQRAIPLGHEFSPGKDGFGTTLIQRSVQYDLNGSFKRQITSAGCICTIDVPLNEIGSKE